MPTDTPDCLPATTSSTDRSCLGKRRYWSQVDAMVMAAKCVQDRHLEGLATYHCGNCRGWHLTRSL